MPLSHLPHSVAAVVVALAAALPVAVAVDVTTFLAAFDVVDAALLWLCFALSAPAAMDGSLAVATTRARHIRSDKQHRPQLEATMPGAFPDRVPVCPAEQGRIELGRHVL